MAAVLNQALESTALANPQIWRQLVYLPYVKQPADLTG